MSVSNETQIQYREFPGFQSPSLPMGMWAISGLAVGDASGGTRTVILVFNPLTSPRSPLFYSLEQITIADDDGNAAAGQLRTVNMDPLQGSVALALTKFWDAPLIAGPGARAELSPQSNANFRGLFLGRQALSGVVCSLNYQTVNADLNIVTVTAEGYWWGPRSINALGGPSRPPSGMYPL